MDRTVADLNIAHFKKLLEAETDPVKRETLQRLLAEEQAKRARTNEKSADRRSPDQRKDR